MAPFPQMSYFNHNYSHTIHLRARTTGSPRKASTVDNVATQMMEIKVHFEGSRSSTNRAGYESTGKEVKDVLNGLIQELWAQANSWKPIEHDPRGPQRMVTLIQVLEESGQG
ncbi:hypothetical protein CJ030_MR8G002817 [Morella rubra]|uniref:Uncharacterized protein n=1 Tax=Morella rubra TaxID=262757 RepID=A0A6A1UUH5_9ROSI|nr:hypothetical protein CJ030_MR8G002817 [Morella rubra]